MHNQKIPKLGNLLKDYFYNLNKSNDIIGELFNSLAFKNLSKSLKKYLKSQFAEEICKLIILDHLTRLTHNLKEKPKNYLQLYEYHKIFDLAADLKGISY